MATNPEELSEESEQGTWNNKEDYRSLTNPEMREIKGEALDPHTAEELISDAKDILGEGKEATVQIGQGKFLNIERHTKEDGTEVYGSQWTHKLGKEVTKSLITLELLNDRVSGKIETNRYELDNKKERKKFLKADAEEAKKMGPIFDPELTPSETDSTIGLGMEKRARTFDTSEKNAKEMLDQFKRAKAKVQGGKEALTKEIYRQIDERRETEKRQKQ